MSRLRVPGATLLGIRLLTVARLCAQAELAAAHEAVGITNGGLYSAQLNVTKNLLNQASVDNLLLQNKVSNESIALSTEEMEHTLAKNMTDAYIMAYQLQLQADFTSQVLEDLKTRLKV